MQGFKQFLLRGNVVDLAVGVVIGAAFNTVVTSFTSAFLTPLIALFAGKQDFSKLSFTVASTRFVYGNFLNALIAFIILAAVVYFLVVLPMNTLVDRVKTKKSPDPTTKKCPFCFTEIPIRATRCPNCTAQIKGKNNQF